MDKDTWLPRVVGAFLVTMPYYPERSIRHDHEEGDMESRARLTPIVQANSARAAAWRVFFEASGRLQGILETRLKRTYGVSMPDYNILLALWEAPQPPPTHGRAGRTRRVLAIARDLPGLQSVS